MFPKRLFSMVFAGALALSPLAAEVVVRIAPPRMSWSSIGVVGRAPTTCGCKGTIAGMATLTPGPRASGNSRHGRMPAGKRITGFTAMTAG